MEDIKHFGILGMKWGIRKRVASKDHSDARAIRKKHVSELSNDEIRKAVTRMQLEKQYSDLSSASTARGNRILKGILGRVASQLVNNFVRQKAGADYAGYEVFAEAIRGKTKKNN